MPLAFKWLLLASTAVAALLVRDFLFVNINFTLGHHHQSWPVEAIHPLVRSSLLSINPQVLYYSKYLFTAFFVALFYVLQLTAARLHRQHDAIKNYLRIVYFWGLLLACALFAGGYAVGSWDEGYTLSRLVSGWLQSPAILCIFLLASPLLKQSKE